MISEYGGKEKYASKEEQKKHEAKETPKKEQQEAPKPAQKKIVLAKKKAVNEDGNDAATEKAYMEEVRAQMKREKEYKEKDKKTPVGMMIEGKKAENRGDMKEARRLYDAAKRAGLKT